MMKFVEPNNENKDDKIGKIREIDDIINTLRKILSDMEAGRSIRAALDLQALIQELGR